MYKLYCRIYQQLMRLISKFLSWREPQLIEGENSVKQLPKQMKNFNVESALIVTDKGIIATGLIEPLLETLQKENIVFSIYDQTVPNPTVENVEAAVEMYEKNNCQGIIAFGGGSPIDCAKMTGARIARPRKTINEMKGLFKILKKLPPLFVVPTTAGTGAEGTLAAVCSNNKTKEKFPMMDTSLIPDVAVLDPLLTIKLPPRITAATGMDALTHAVEAYIGKSNTKETKQWSIAATKLVFENLFEAYTNGEDVVARKNMQKAAYYAGLAFTRAYVGYVHAIAHTLGGFYNVPHGLANAIILPYVLEYYGDSVHQPLAELADVVGISSNTDNDEQKANKFIRAIKELNEQMEIPNKVSEINNSDIPLMVQRALNEANPLYPVPKILFKEDITKLYEIIKV